jgi:hypothetical protein
VFFIERKLAAESNILRHLPTSDPQSQESPAATLPSGERARIRACDHTPRALVFARIARLLASTAVLDREAGCQRYSSLGPSRPLHHLSQSRVALDLVRARLVLRDVPLIATLEHSRSD